MLVWGQYARDYKRSPVAASKPTWRRGKKKDEAVLLEPGGCELRAACNCRRLVTASIRFIWREVPLEAVRFRGDLSTNVCFHA
jgi:hypothetical protein